MRTLVVEDNKGTRDMLESVLVARGHRVTTTERAETATALHHADPFDLLLLDIVLPGMDGLKLCRWLRSLPRGEVPVILAITSRNSPQDLQAVLTAGATDYLAKPVEPALLQTRLAVAERAVAAQTSRVRAEEALRRSEANLRTMIENSPDAVMVLREKRLIFANKRCVQWLGYQSPTQLLGWHIRELMLEEDLGPLGVDEKLAPELDRTSPPMEARWKRLDGVVLDAEVSTMKVLLDDVPSLLCTVRDLTERKKLQRRLTLSDRLASVGTLAAGVAHEINNPLAYILVNVDYVNSNLQRIKAQQAQLPVDLQQMINALVEARHGVSRVGAIVRDLGVFARPQADAIEAVDISRALGQAVSMTNNEIRHRARLVQDVAHTLLARANQGRLTQVLVNLLINAAHAIPDGNAENHTIRVSTRDGEAGAVVVEVSDSGNGIAPADLGRIFDPFFTTKPVGEGTGLGLSICHGIIHGWGGELTVESRVGKGSTFRMLLPAAQAPADPVTPPQLAAEAPVRARVLVVDDEISVCSAVRRLLSDAHEVVTIMDARDALTTLASGVTFDVILTDLMMPDLCGMDFLAELQRIAPAQATRVVFMTGGAFTTRAQEFLTAQAPEVLEKPFDADTLGQVIQRRMRAPADAQAASGHLR